MYWISLQLNYFHKLQILLSIKARKNLKAPQLGRWRKQNQTFPELMRSKVKNVTTWSAIFELSEPDKYVYTTLCLPKDTEIEVQRCLALDAAGPKQYLFMDNGGKINLINIPNLYV